MKTLSAIFIFNIISTALAAQSADTLTLEESYRMAYENAPRKQQFKLHSSSSALAVESLATGNLPTLSAYGKAWYQSDAVTTPAFGPGMEGLAIDQFQYNLGVELTQKLFDGGAIAKQKQVEKSSLRVNHAALEADLYQLNDQVNRYFFSILLLQDAKNLLDLKKETLRERAEIMTSAVKNGVLLRSELEKMEAEIMAADQQQIDIEFSISTLKNNIKTLTGIGRDQLVVIKKPAIVDVPDTMNRPEYRVFEARQEKLEKMKSLKGTQLMPKISAYAQAGYSYPGLNFFENQADPYYIVGGRLSWTLFDWSKTKKEKEILSIQKENIEVQREALDRQLSMAAASKTAEIDKLRQLIVKDKQIIEKRESITRASSSALDNGAITSADYLEDLNAGIRARLDLKKHETQLLQARAELAVIKGITIE